LSEFKLKAESVGLNVGRAVSFRFPAGEISLLFSFTFPLALDAVSQQSPGLKRLERVSIHHQDKNCIRINIFLLFAL
jgi:hypothetical protein